MPVEQWMKELPAHFLVLIFVILTFVLTFGYSGTHHTYALVADPRIYTNDTKPYGVPYDHWAQLWWNWSQSIPEPIHPREHPSEQTCKVAQHGPVWFLADLLSGTQQRSCTIPASKSIFVPLVGGFCGSDSAGVTDDTSLRQCAISGDNYATMQVTLDGKEIKNLDQYRIQGSKEPFFMVTYGSNNIYKHKPGSAKGAVDGFYLFLRPMTPGQHLLDLKTSVLNPTDNSFNYSADLIYRLTIQ